MYEIWLTGVAGMILVGLEAEGVRLLDKREILRSRAAHFRLYFLDGSHLYRILLKEKHGNFEENDMIMAVMGRCEFCGQVHPRGDARSPDDCKLYGLGTIGASLEFNPE